MNPVPTVATAAADLEARMARGQFAPLWHHAAELLPPEPAARARAHSWAWEEVEGALTAAGIAVDPSEAERRVLLLTNPGLEPQVATTPTLVAGMQLLRPGEVARTHRHTATAVRFVISGAGAATVNDGCRTPMTPGDLVLTPSWTWHDHEAGDQPVIWLDVLDVPLVRRLEAGFFELYPEPRQPAIPDPPEGVFEWAPVVANLERRASESGQGLVTHHYSHPDTGAAVTTTIGARAHRLAPGAVVDLGRETASSIVHVVAGRGRSTVGERAVAWSAGDTFVLPGWAPVSHANPGDEAALLVALTDRPALEALGLYRQG